MKFNQLNGFAFDRETNTLGAIAGVDFLKQTISIMTDNDEIVVASLKTTAFLEKVGTIGNVGIINHDVLTTADGKLFEVELLADGETVQIHLINEKLERIDTGDSFPKGEIGQLAPYVNLVGNINLLEPVEETVDFNIKIVRMSVDGVIEYFYACNNADVEEVDLIKVVFVGHHLLEETAYERFTVTHEEYLAMVENGEVTETTPQNLMNYVTGLTYGQTAVAEEEDFEEEYEEEDEDFEDEESEDCDCQECRIARGEEVDEDYCEDCGEHNEDCDCYGW